MVTGGVTGRKDKKILELSRPASTLPASQATITIPSFVMCGSTYTGDGVKHHLLISFHNFKTLSRARSDASVSSEVKEHIVFLGYWINIIILENVNIVEGF